MKKVLAFWGVVLILALIAGVVYFVYVFTGEFSTDFKTFYVEIDKTKYVKDTYDLTFGKTRVDVHYTFEKVQTKKLTYSYAIDPTGSDFNFTVDGEKVSWLNVDGLSAAFDVKKDENGLTFDCANKKVSDILKAVYPNSEIVLPDGIDDERVSRYKLTVTAEDKRTSVSLTFKCSAVVENITLDPSEITF